MWHWPESLGGRIAAIVLSILTVLLVLIGFALGTGPGHTAVAWIVARTSDGDVVIEGLSGNLLNQLRVQTVELRDANGRWLRADGISLDWRVLSLFSNHINISNARIADVVMYRPEVAKPSTSKSTWRIDVDNLSVRRIELKKAAIGHPAVLTASGSVHYVSRHDASADLAITRLDGIGEYRVRGSIRNDFANGLISIAESGNGIVGGFAGAPDLGPVSLEIEAGGQARVNAISLQLQAGALQASGQGKIDLAGRTAQIDFSASAPAMHPRKDLSWSSATADGHVYGPFDRPEIRSSLTIRDFTDAGYSARELSGQLSGHAGAVDLKMAAVELRVPGSKPNLLASAPLVLTAHADLTAARRPVRIAVDHPLLHATAKADTRGAVQGQVSVAITAVGPFAAAAGTALDGQARFDGKFSAANDKTNVALTGQLFARGDTVLPRALGNAKIDATASMNAAGSLSVAASLSGNALKAKLSGGTSNGNNDYQVDVTISDLSRAVPALIGSLTAHGRLDGRASDMHLALNAGGLVGTKGFARQRISITASAAGLPKLRSAEVHASGSFDGSPLVVAATAAPEAGGALKVSLDRAQWRSLWARGLFISRGSSVQGSASLHIAHVADVTPIIGQAVHGILDARLDIRPGRQHPVATVHVVAQKLQSGSATLGDVKLDGTITDPLSKPVLALTLVAPQFAAPAVSGSAKTQFAGPLDSLSITASSSTVMNGNQAVTLAAAALVDLPKNHATLKTFRGDWQGQVVTLAAPATADLENGVLAFNATFVEGSSARVEIRGRAPLKAGRPMNVRVSGFADVGRLTSSLASIGESFGGKFKMDVTVTGTSAKPRASGTMTLSGGELHDYTNGVSLSNIDATAQAQDDTVRLTHFTARAGHGTVTGSGSIDIRTPGMPVNVTFQAHNARPIVSDLITVTLDSDLKLQGKLGSHVRLGGTVRITQGNINVPQKFPPSVAVLDVRRANTPPPRPSSPGMIIGLDVTVSSPGRIFVRGRGLDVEVAGDIKVSGTTASPRVLGALTMRRGTLSLAGTTLDFQSGEISFTGGGPHGALDPTLNFVAQTSSNGVTATLKITGTASQPKLELTSTPPLPQDEILAQLLFHQSVKQLSPFQVAQVAQAVASFSGIGSGFDPVSAMRRSLGLDRLSIGSASAANGENSGTSIEAGKYILHNVYLGARQDLSGGTHAVVQVDITKNLKAEAAVTTGTRTTATTSTPLQDNGDSLGLTYQFEY